VESKVAVLCDFAEAEEPALKVKKKREEIGRFRPDFGYFVPFFSSGDLCICNCAGGASGGGRRRRHRPLSRFYCWVSAGDIPF
jgi:hypothetical protein